MYEIQFWEVQRIINGYRRRNGLMIQLQRLTAYMACFSMRDAKGKTPPEWLPLPIDEDDDTNDGRPIGEDEQKELEDMLRAMNAGQP